MTIAGDKSGTADKRRAGDRPRTRWRRNLAVAARWLHIYLSMGSFALVLFFAATGLTLNHPDWFAGHEKTVVHHGAAPRPLLRTANAEGADRLGLVEFLRAHDHVAGTVTDFRVDDSQVSISLRAPGYTADAFIDRDTGKYDLTEVRSGLAAVLNDLHRGQAAGKVWARVIDASAIALVLVSLTGLVLIWFIQKRRTSGLVLAALAAAAMLALWRLAVQ